MIAVPVTIQIEGVHKTIIAPDFILYLKQLFDGFQRKVGREGKGADGGVGSDRPVAFAEGQAVDIVAVGSGGSGGAPETFFERDPVLRILFTRLIVGER